MKDTLHTNQQRIEKIRGLIEYIHMLQGGSFSAAFAADRLTSLLDLAQEAEGSLDAIEDFLRERKALDRNN